MQAFRISAAAAAFAASVALVGLPACSSVAGVTGAQASARTLDGGWQVQAVDGKPLDGARKPELTFDTGKNTVTGFDGCNRISGGYSLEGGRLTAPRLVSTRMACLGDEPRRASAAIAELFANGAEVVETTVAGERVLTIRNAKAEIRLRKTQ